jgi:UDP:flavonoid glycosyltransferase YjiC (YdhE family)
MDQSDLLIRIAQALSSIPVRGVITTGPAVDPVDVPAAANVVVVRTAAHTELISQADLVVTHAGHGTLIKAIAAGVPTLCLPLGRDQHDNAARAARHGVGLVLSARSDADTIADAIGHMFHEPSFRAAAAALGEQIWAEIVSGALMEELEDLPQARNSPEAGGRESAWR